MLALLPSGKDLGAWTLLFDCVNVVARLTFTVCDFSGTPVNILDTRFDLFVGTFCV